MYNREISLEILGENGIYVINQSKKKTRLIAWLFAFHEIDKTSRLKTNPIEEVERERKKQHKQTYIYSGFCTNDGNWYDSVYTPHHNGIDKSVQDL